MAFKEVLDLNAEITTAIGGTNKKTGKPNPKSLEGFYLGKRQVEDRKKKSGVSYIYIFQTQKGNVGVWGKTDLDRKMLSVTPGCMTRVTHSGMQETPNGPMYKYRVEMDKDNTVDVSDLDTSSTTEQSTESYTEESSEESYNDTDTADYEEAGLDSDEPAQDETPPARATAPRQVAKTPDAERQARVKALLAGNKRPA